MSKKLQDRIEELERKVRELEARPPVTIITAPPVPFPVPTPQPYYVPMPVPYFPAPTPSPWPPHWPIVTCISHTSGPNALSGYTLMS